MESKKRYKQAGYLRGIPILLLLLLFGSCNWGVPYYTLTVVVEDGVTGTPEPGQYVYVELTNVEFAYTPVNPLHTVEVLLNNKIRKSGSSSIVMYRDGYELKARLVDIRGVWEVTMTYADTSIQAPDPFKITISGPDLLSGNFSDSRGYHGTWTAESNVLTLAYYDWNFYVLTGTVLGLGDETGTFTGEGLSGTWTSEKVN
jgi:hypothetical protein